MKLPEIIKKKVFYIPSIIFAIILLISVFYWMKPASAQYETVPAERQNLRQEISVTGKVKPAENVELAFEVGGKVVNTHVKVGDKVKKNQKLVSLNSSEFSAQLRQANAQVQNSWAQIRQAQAALSGQEIRLQELKLGTRSDELQLAATSVENAKNNLQDAETNLKNTVDRGEIDLTNAYLGALSSLQNSLTVAENTLYTITDIQADQFSGTDNAANTIADYKALAVQDLLGQSSAGRYNNYTLSQLNGGTKGTISSLVANPSNEKIELAIPQLKTSLQKIKMTLDAFPIDPQSLSTDNSAKISSAKTAVNAEISTLTAKSQAISTQRTTNLTSQLNAQSNVTNARNNLASAESQYNIKKNGATKEQVAAQEAQVRQSRAVLNSQYALLNQARANVSAVQAQMAKNVITSPIDGVITEQNAKRGQIVLPNSPIVKVMADSKFEIEANIPEVDVAKVKINNIASLTLDAFGDEEFFANVIQIDPAEKIIEGVPTYKITLQFDKEDPRIKSGLTVNLDILTDKKENVIVIPQRAIVEQDGVDVIRILKDDGIIKEIDAKVGLRGSNGKVEILQGIKEGDNIITSMLNK